MKIPGKALAMGAAVLIVASGTFGAFHYASAQEGTSTPSATAGSATPNGADTTKREQAVDAFLSKVAANLNVSADQLKSAIKDAGLQTVDELVAGGKLTADQGAKIKDAINSGKYPELARLFKRRAALLGHVEKGIVAASAKAIGIDAKGLAGQLKSGKSIADVAAEHNVAIETVKTEITTDAKTRLDAAVQKGAITQEQEDAAMQRLTANLDKILNHHRGDKTAPDAAVTPGT